MLRLLVPLLLLVLGGEALTEELAASLPVPDYRAEPSDPAWLRQVVQLHGHLGPAVVAGARLGMFGRQAVAAHGYFDVAVTCEGPLAKPPQSCFLDGLQLATGATLGKRSLHWVPAEQLSVRIQNTRTGKSVVLTPTPTLLELLASFRPQPRTAIEPAEHATTDARLEALARKIAGMPEQELATVRELNTPAAQ